MRNLADRCEVFVEEWTVRMAALSADPGPATQFAAPGLRAVCSLAELAAVQLTEISCNGSSPSAMISESTRRPVTGHRYSRYRTR